MNFFSISTMCFKNTSTALAIDKLVSLLIKTNTTSGANNNIYDAAYNNDIEVLGNTQISTSVKKYADSSIAFDGAGDYLSLPYSDKYVLTDTDSCVEAWVYLNSLPGAANTGTIGALACFGVGAYFGNIYDNNWLILLEPTQITVAGSNGTTLAQINAPLTYQKNTWFHVAVTRTAAGLTTIYRNGVPLRTGQTLSGNNTAYSLQIGRGAYGDNLIQNYFNGHIENFKITKSLVYTGAFTPPVLAD